MDSKPLKMLNPPAFTTSSYMTFLLPSLNVHCKPAGNDRTVPHSVKIFGGAL